MNVDLSGEIYASFKRAQSRARAYLEEGSHLRAAAAYRQCARFMQQYAKYVTSVRVKAQWVKKAQTYERRAEELEEMRPVEAPVSSVRGPGEAVHRDEITALIYNSDVEWDDIGGLEETKREIKAAYGLALAQKPPHVQLPGWRMILFYGPPGTGKTLLAAATSNGLEATFFNVKTSNLVSKYFGESPRLISALFAEARGRAPSVVFLDEFESLSLPRGSGESGAERRIVSTLLSELDGLVGKGDDRYVLTIAATNVPWLIDAAILRRFERRIYIPLPDGAARRRILQIHLEERGHRTKIAYAELVRRTEGYSGREIQQLCNGAIERMADRTNPGLVRAVDRGREATERYRIRTVPLTTEDFDVAFEKVRPQTTEQELAMFCQWGAGP